MKRYVSLAGALLVGTVVANEKKPAFKNEVAQASTQEVATVKQLFLQSKNVARYGSHSQKKEQKPVH
jgi:hypothetical protein